MSIEYDWKALIKNFLRERCSLRQDVHSRTRYIFDGYRYWLVDKGYKPKFKIIEFSKFFGTTFSQYSQSKINGFLCYDELYINDERIQRQIEEDNRLRKEKDSAAQCKRRQKNKEKLQEKDNKELGEDPNKWSIENVNMNSVSTWLENAEKRLKSKNSDIDILLMKEHLYAGLNKCSSAKRHGQGMDNKILWSALFKAFREQILEKYTTKEKENGELYLKVERFLFDGSNKNILDELLNDFSSRRTKDLAHLYFPDEDQIKTANIFDRIAFNYFSKKSDKVKISYLNI